MSYPRTPIGDVWLGIDLGTQSVRALAVLDDGTVVGSGSAGLASHRDGPRHEQDPEQWWQAVGTACRHALADVAPQAVRAVAVDATSGTVLLVDRDGRPLTPALMYDDTRAADEVNRVNDVGAAVWEILGYRRMQPSWALPKLLWLIREYAALLPEARLAHQNDFINQRLTGHQVPTDLSNALKTGAQLITESWPLDVLDTLGVPARLMPYLVRSGTTIGAVSASAAIQTRIPAGTAVISGATDGCAAQLGAGALRVGSWNSVLGTTLVVKGVTRELVRDPLAVVYSHKSPNGQWLPGGASSTGAGIISRDYAGRDLAELNHGAAHHEPAAVLAYPLVSRGERFPFVAPQAEAFLLGTPQTDAERYAAVLQGVAFIERLCFDYLDLIGAPVDGDIVLTGGATRNEYWNQLRADVLHRPLTLPTNAEPALGMAVLAASPQRNVADVALEMVRTSRIIEPRADAAGRYDETYARFLAELEGRGWLSGPAATHARERTKR
ncbi:FGGY family carbohydrate kinase [Pseudofrankia sp. BMG5.36]|uniref:FGGY-family carbohydrate kinase n=1 Tax=Pseudofrankia sp. BMG5.36 TaxID=1834512 RepID=UPI0008D98115|nr:FGGY family carbohydrate kinase [Pseudofrankia sp. BMG5.36]OHV43453.1 carbohydrate kinase [Pseudofrankia sp. BMG5.36]